MTANLAKAAVRRAVAQLVALAGDLAGHGFDARLSGDAGTLNLSVINPALPGSRETIAAAPADDGVWWFWWSWGGRIARLSDVAPAAFKFACVLTPQAG